MSKNQTIAFLNPSILSGPGRGLTGGLISWNWLKLVRWISGPASEDAHGVAQLRISRLSRLSAHERTARQCCRKRCSSSCCFCPAHIAHTSQPIVPPERSGTQADAEEAVSDVLPPALGREGTHRPYFEVLIVTGAPATRWSALRAEWRRLRRPLDPFVYEPVFVGSFEDAFCAAMLNTELAAVILHEGFPFRSRHDAPVLRSMIEVADQKEASQASAASVTGVEAGPA